MLHLTKLLGAGLLSVGLLCMPSFARPRAVHLDADTPEAMATIQGAGAHKDKIHGTVTFIQDANGVKMHADIEGLSPGEHGFHIHATPIKDGDLKSAGGHWNPTTDVHGAPNAPKHHAGDMGNLTADANGHAVLDLEMPGVTVTGKESVVGHSVIIHANKDDLKSQPAGDSGDRIAGGNIELKTTK